MHIHVHTYTFTYTFTYTHTHIHIHQNMFVKLSKITRFPFVSGKVPSWASWGLQWLPRRSKTTQESPRWHQDVPRRPNRTQDGLKIVPRWLRDASRWPQDGPNWRQDGPRRPKRAPSSPRRPPRRPKGRPRGAPRRPKSLMFLKFFQVFWYFGNF